jgi:hypothetical protein
VTFLGKRIRAETITGAPVSFGFPRSCLGNPSSIRVAAQTFDFLAARPRDSDWAQRRHTFYRAVGRA